MPCAEHFVRFAGEALPRGVPGPLYVISVLTPSHLGLPFMGNYKTKIARNSLLALGALMGLGREGEVEDICVCSVVLDSSFRKGMIFGRGYQMRIFLTTELLISGSKPYRFSVLTSITNEGRFPSTRCPGTPPI
jgi:hypothetical protein